MEKSNKRSFWKIAGYVAQQSFVLFFIGISALIFLIFSGMFLASLYIRNFFRKKCCKYNSNSK